MGPSDSTAFDGKVGVQRWEYIKKESLDYISASDSMGLSSFKFLWRAPKDVCFV